jgi:hypothetical protein
MLGVEPEPLWLDLSSLAWMRTATELIAARADPPSSTPSP